MDVELLVVEDGFEYAVVLLLLLVVTVELLFVEDVAEGLESDNSD